MILSFLSSSSTAWCSASVVLRGARFSDLVKRELVMLSRFFLVVSSSMLFLLLTIFS